MVGRRLRGQLWPLMSYAAAARPERPGPTGRFVILTGGRAGSELLVTRLGSHPAILCDSELLARRRLAPRRIVAGRVRIAAGRGFEAYGLKLLPRHIGPGSRLPPGWLAGLHADGWAIVRLRRRNRLHQAISGMRASQTQYHFTAGTAPPFVPLVANVARLGAELDHYERTEREADELIDGLPALQLVYEDDLVEPADQERTVRRIIDALGLAPAPTASTQVRINPATARQMLANYDEVAAALRAGAHARHLDDERGSG